jgi:hypothetical protein
LQEAAGGPQCHAVFHGGRWQWLAAPAGAHEETCPACRRTQQRFPAGFVTLQGEFFQQHRDELMALVNRHAEHAKAEHPLGRISDQHDQQQELQVVRANGAAERLQPGDLLALRRHEP